MNGAKRDAWWARPPALEHARKRRLEAALTGAASATTEARELDALGVSCRLRCAAGSPVRFDDASGLQRYKGHACRRTFNALIGAPLARLLYRDAWRLFAQTLIDGESVRALAAKACVDRNAVFRWRHEFLSRNGESSRRSGYQGSPRRVKSSREDRASARER